VPGYSRTLIPIETKHQRATARSNDENFLQRGSSESNIIICLFSCDTKCRSDRRAVSSEYSRLRLHPAEISVALRTVRWLHLWAPCDARIVWRELARAVCQFPNNYFNGFKWRRHDRRVLMDAINSARSRDRVRGHSPSTFPSRALLGLFFRQSLLLALLLPFFFFSSFFFFLFADLNYSHVTLRTEIRDIRDIYVTRT